MLYKLSAGMKNAVDTILALVGLIGGVFVSNASALHSPWNIVADAGGLVLGYFASDAIAYIDTGQKASLQTVITQGISAFQQVKPSLVDQIKKDITDPSSQAIAIGVLETVEHALALQSPATAPAPITEPAPK